MVARFVGVGVAMAVAACAQHGSNQQLVATFSNISDGSFAVQAIAPPETIREYAICKAVWFAEKKGAPRMSLGNPEYPDPTGVSVSPSVSRIPPGWVVLRATAYLTAPNPDGNPAFAVSERAGPCRQMWDWYR